MEEYEAIIRTDCADVVYGGGTFLLNAPSAIAGPSGNTVSHSTGDSGELYGGKTTSLGQDAQNNTVIITAGSILGGTGALTNVYGGYLTAGGGGAAQFNKVIVRSGAGVYNFGSPSTPTNVYGGYVVGNGFATSNEIVLEGTAHATHMTNYFGAGSDGIGTVNMSVNGLTVSMSGDANHYGNIVYTINNFQTMAFDLGTANNGDTLLTVRSQLSAQTFDWGLIWTTNTNAFMTRLAATGISNPSVTFYSGTSAPLTLTNYAPRDMGVVGDYEMVMKATGGTLSGSTMTGATKIIWDTNRFRNATTTASTGAATDDVWAGRSIIGNTTTNNNLTLTSTTHRDAYGGWMSGTGTTNAAKDDSTDNTVNISGTASVRHVYGGMTDAAAGKATGNEVHIAGGTITGTVYGGANTHATGTGAATGNTVTI